jgi:hypothetical protein
MRILVRLLAAFILVLGAGAVMMRVPAVRRVVAPQPFRPVADVKLLMQAMVDPAADVGWNAVGTTISTEGVKEWAPKTDEEWVAVRNSGVILMESGNLLMMESRAKDSREWIKASQALVEAGAVVMKAAEARDPARVFASGEVTYNACEGCHQQYLYPFQPEGGTGPDTPPSPPGRQP